MSTITPAENAAHARQAFESGALALDNFPSRLTIESTAICNLRCVMCPQSIEGGVDRPKHMPIDMFAKLAEPMAHAGAAQLHGIGEPLASPSFWHGLKGDYFSPDAELSINTNMTLLNDRRLKALAETKLKLGLNISIDAATPLTYKRIRGAEFEEVVGNIRRLRAARGDRQYPRMRINMTLMRENIEEVVAFVELGKELSVDAVCFWHMNRMPDDSMARFSVDRDNWHFEYSEQGLWNFPALSNRMLKAALRRGEELGMPINFDQSKTAFFGEDEVAESAPVETIKNCTHPWDNLVVASNGEARTCCYSQPVGNMNDASFAEIWNGQAMRDLRRDMKQDRVNPICRGAACKYVANTPEPVAAPEAASPAPEKRFSVLALLKRWSASARRYAP
jgi:MoaA/NifB/PqqE/SkfB family radical SAM enzyme